MSAVLLEPRGIRDIAPDVLDTDGRLRVLPGAYWATTTTAERALFGHRYGLYSFPTVELVDRLRVLIDGRSAIEIGAGHGVLADALGIPGTDNRMQEREPYRSIYARGAQPTVPYGPSVVRCDAAGAVRRYKPQVVIGAWITHRFDAMRRDVGGNEIGVDELDVLGHCGTYIFVGNEHVHRHSRLWTRPHGIEYPPWLYSRAHNGSPDFIAVWERQVHRP